MDNLDSRVVPRDYPLDYLREAMSKGEGREVYEREVLAIARILFLEVRARPLFVVDGGGNDNLSMIELELREILRIHGLPEKRWPDFSRSGDTPWIALKAYVALRDLRRWRRWTKRVIGEKRVTSGGPGSPHAIGQRVSAGLAEASDGRPDDGGPVDDPSLRLAVTMVSHYSYLVGLHLHHLTDRLPDWPAAERARRMRHSVQPKSWHSRQEKLARRNELILETWGRLRSRRKEAYRVHSDVVSELKERHKIEVSDRTVRRVIEKSLAN